MPRRFARGCRRPSGPARVRFLQFGLHGHQVRPAAHGCACSASRAWPSARRGASAPASAWRTCPRCPPSRGTSCTRSTTNRRCASRSDGRAPRHGSNRRGAGGRARPSRLELTASGPVAAYVAMPSHDAALEHPATSDPRSPVKPAGMVTRAQSRSYAWSTKLQREPH